MSIADDVREHYLKPENLGAELTLIEISAAINCDDDKRLGIELWCMVNRSHELKSAKNAEGKNVYRWNEKRERVSTAGGKPAKPSTRKSPRVEKPHSKAAKVQRKTAISKRRRAEKSAVTHGVKPDSRRWALTDDGTFIDLSCGREIPNDRARALVKFIRTLDEASA